MRGILKALLQIERRNRLVVEGDLNMVGAAQCLGIQRNLVFDFVRAGELWIHVIGIAGLLTMKHCKLPDIRWAGTSEEFRIESLWPNAIVFDGVNASQKTRGQRSAGISDQFLVDLHLTPRVYDLIMRLDWSVRKPHRLLTFQYLIGQAIKDEAQFIRTSRSPQRVSLFIQDEKLQKHPAETDPRREIVRGLILSHVEHGLEAREQRELHHEVCAKRRRRRVQRCRLLRHPVHLLKAQDERELLGELV